MGLILDSSILVTGERRGVSVSSILESLKEAHGDVETGLSSVTVVELAHGIYRVKTDLDRTRREAFVDELCRAVVVYPVTLEIARLAGKIEGEEAARGIPSRSLIC